MVPGMNSDHLFRQRWAVLVRCSFCVFCLAFRATAAVRHPLQTRRTGLPASHAGVADVSSTPDQLSAMAWITTIIESLLSRRQTSWRVAASNLALERRSHREPEGLTRLPQQE